MTGNTIRVVSEYGSNLTTRSLGRRLRQRVVTVTRAYGEVTLDFLRVDSATQSFIQELIVGLVEEQGFGWLSRHVHLQNLSAELSSDVRAVLRRWETNRPRRSTEDRPSSQL